MRDFRIPLRIVFYREDERWVAHCLEFDVCGDGTTQQEAAECLAEAIRLQVQYTLESGMPQNLICPAPGEIHERFFAGKDTAQAELAIVLLPIEHIRFETPQCREYSDGYSDSEKGCVTA